MTIDNEIREELRRIADALDRLSPETTVPLNPENGDAFIWNANQSSLKIVPNVNRVDLSLLCGIELSKKTLLENTKRFGRGLPANNALLWGARGMGKSSLIKAVHKYVADQIPDKLALVEIHREDIGSLPILLNLLRTYPKQFVVFCDDLSFDAGETDYKALKAVLEGGIEGRPANVIFYATSNRRHMMARESIEEEAENSINPSDIINDKISLSDRFGIWLGFHACDQKTFLQMVEAYANFYGLNCEKKTLKAESIEWSMTRGSRSGRVAWQYVQDLAGRMGKIL
tara:strand:+ start:959 stop:1816 length:858 start_codon:yes stop_codon:yes gene_type:complete